MAKMHAMIVPEPRGRFRMVERDLPEPDRHEVRIRVHACGVCHRMMSGKARFRVVLKIAA
jgi:D-arabinose 1-dehydrogenase-like Zn-dependent alcohol dehydrogenase